MAAFWILICGLAWTGSPALAAGQLPPSAQAVINKPLYRHSVWGLLVADQNTGQVVYQLNAGKLFAPASNTKLFTTAAALQDLGADYRYQTPVYQRGRLSKRGVLDGDLILVASGDLTLGGRTTPEGRIAFRNEDHTYAAMGGAKLTETDPLAGLNDLARQVSAAGINRVDGQVIIDDRLFESGLLEPGASLILTPMVVNDNVIDLVITPTRPGQPAKVKWRPRSGAWRVDAQVLTVPKGGQPDGSITSPGLGKVVVRGAIPADAPPTVQVAQVEHPAEFARALFIEALERAGVSVSASALTPNPRQLLPYGQDYKNYKRVALLTSPPLAESIRLILKTSHNLGADLLPLTLAAHHGLRGFEQGMALEGQILKKMGVPMDQVSLSDGEGGVIADRVTPTGVVKLLRIMAQHKDFKAYYDALPILGVDGTLHNAVGPDSPARGKIRAKTGTSITSDLAGQRLFITAKAFAGYMTAHSGRKLVFAFYVNSALAGGMAQVRQLGRDFGQLCEAIYLAN